MDLKIEGIEYMAENLIKRWNDKVTDEDHIYILGDISWYSPKKTNEILYELNGIKHLIRGNHDNNINSFAKNYIFKEVVDYKKIDDGDYKIIMSHFPMPFYEFQSKNSIILYGHLHNAPH